MYLLISNSNNPYFNLATEEFLLKNNADDIIFLYRNESCIVVGKHQNALAEINYQFVHENKIPLIRRISGGGTVYHDDGNINFTFIQNGEEGKLVNFKAFITPVSEFLTELGIINEIGSRNDILVNGLKVSGNAEHIYKKRTLHHGTLLFSSTLTDLRNALKTDSEKYSDKAVKSVRSKVTNIKDNLEEEISTSQFYNLLIKYLHNYYKASSFELTAEAISQIQQLADSKYKDWQWNFGYSPNYIFRNNINIDTFSLKIELTVEKGIIKDALLVGNLENSMLINLKETLLNQQHSISAISRNNTIINLESRVLTGNSEILWSFF